MATSYPNNGLTNGQLIKYLELPETIIEDLQTTEGDTFSATANQFLTALFNKVLYQTVSSMEFSNPFKKYDGFPINYGDTIENIFVEMPVGYKYDKDATDPFVRSNPKVKALYATINYELQYEVTIYDALLRRACLSEYGFMNLIDQILASLSKSMSLDEYKATICMLNNADIFANGIENVTRQGTAAETGKEVTKTIVNAVDAFKFPMTSNNKMRVTTSAAPGDVLLIIKYGLLNDINLDYLAGVFNLSKVDLINNIIKVDGFRVAKPGEDSSVLVGEDIDFMVIDTRGIDSHVALQDGGSIYNPRGKYTNHYANLWMVKSFKYFHNARAFKLVDGE